MRGNAKRSLASAGREGKYAGIYYLFGYVMSSRLRCIVDVKTTAWQEVGCRQAYVVRRKKRRFSGVLQDGNV